jgi:ABC-type glutathione transport system ATPase component
LHALDNVSLTIEPSQIVAVLSPNGAGKTTLLQCLSAIVAPDAGRILYDGEPFNRGRVDLRKRFSFLPEFPIMFPHTSVARHITMVLGLYGVNGESLSATVTQHLHELDLLPAIEMAYVACVVILLLAAGWLPERPRALPAIGATAGMFLCSWVMWFGYKLLYDRGGIDLIRMADNQ